MDKKLEKIFSLLWEIKYRNICVYNTEDNNVSKFLVVATAVSTAENKKLAGIIAEKLKFDGVIDGFHKGEWIIFDLGEIVIHLFASGFRERYNMDKLYKGKNVNINLEKKKNKV